MDFPPSCQCAARTALWAPLKAFTCPECVRYALRHGPLADTHQGSLFAVGDLIPVCEILQKERESSSVSAVLLSEDVEQEGLLSPLPEGYWASILSEEGHDGEDF